MCVLSRPRLLSLLLAVTAPVAVASPLYGFVDGQGVAHVAVTPLDGRYQPLLPDPGSDAGAVPGKTMSRGRLLTWLAFAPEVKALQPLLREAERATGVDAELLKAIVTVESGFRADRVSPAGAIGLMQLMPDAGERYATKAERSGAPVEQRLRQPGHNVMIGARMLADLWRRFGSIDAALAAWNAGEGRVRRAGNKIPDIAETRAHVHLVLELYWALLQQRQHGRAERLSLTAPAPEAGGR
jgi:hypothetical protein